MHHIHEVRSERLNIILLFQVQLGLNGYAGYPPSRVLHHLQGTRKLLSQLRSGLSLLVVMWEGGVH